MINNVIYFLINMLFIAWGASAQVFSTVVDPGLRPRNLCFLQSCAKLRILFELTKFFGKNVSHNLLLYLNYGLQPFHFHTCEPFQHLFTLIAIDCGIGTSLLDHDASDFATLESAALAEEAQHIAS